MALSNLLAMLDEKEVLIPRLRAFIAAESLAEAQHKRSHKKTVITDATLSVLAFRQRIADYRKHDPATKQYFHPSAIGGCLRAMWYDHFRMPQLRRDIHRLLEQYLTFEIGTYLHVVIQNLCERAGLLVEREVAILDHAQRIVGHGDGILLIERLRYLLEFKTSNSRKFAARQQPDHAHVQQAHAYMKALGIRRAVILYMNKDTSALKEFVVDFDDTLYDNFVSARIKDYHRSIRLRKPPEREGSPTEYPCKGCPFMVPCYDQKQHKAFVKRIQNQKP